MRQVKLFLCIALAVALGSCKQGTSTDAGGEYAAPAAGSIVYMQLDSVVNSYDMFNDLRSELEVKIEKIQNELSSKGKAFESDVKDFQYKVNRGFLTQAEAQERSQVLSNRQQDLENLSAQKQAEIAEEEAVLFNKVLYAVKTFVAKYNKEKGYTLIINTSATTNTVMYGAPSLDITNDVIEGLNNEYVKNKKKESKNQEKKETKETASK